jgi:hypothetical protein
MSVVWYLVALVGVCLLLSMVDEPPSGRRMR